MPGEDKQGVTHRTADEQPAPAFPVDDTTLDLLLAAVRPRGPEHDRTSLTDLLHMLSGDGRTPSHPNDVIKALAVEVNRLRGRDSTEPGSPAQDEPAPAGLVLMLIEFDEHGESVGRSWPVDDPGMAAHLRHLAGHLGDPMTDASSSDLDQMYVRIDTDAQPPAQHG
jgi:hypothetical protein